MSAQPTYAPAPAGQAPVDPAPSWGTQTGFFQRHQPAFWLFVITLGICGLDFLAQQLNLISMGSGAWFATIILLIPYAIPVIAIIYYLDLYEREPLSILVAAALWGGIVATVLSMYTNTPLDELIYKITGDANFTQSWSAALTAPFVEEGFKLLGVILLISIARDELDDELDGFVWGAMVGIGFLLVEDTFYFVRAFADSGSYGTIFEMFMIRVLGAGPYSHFLYTGLTGMGVAYYVTRTDKTSMQRLLGGIGLIALGVGAHFFWNSPLLAGWFGDGIIGFYVMVTLKGLPMLIGLAILVRLARKRERRYFAAFSQTFFDDGAITEADLAELSGVRARRRARKAAGRAKGPMGEQLKGQIQRSQIQLAQLMSRFGDEKAPEVAAQQTVVLGLKAQFDALVANPAMAYGAAAAGGAAATWGQPVAAAQAAQAAPVQAAPAAWGQPVAAAAAPVTAAPAVAAAAPVAQAPAEPSAHPTPTAWGQQPATPVAATPAPVAQAPTEPSAHPTPTAWGQQPAAQPAAAAPAQPAPARVQPAPPPAWIPTVEVPSDGMPAWSAPDPAQQPAVALAAGLDLSIAERRGDWARVVAVNGWTGWVDARRLVPRA